LPSCYTVLRKDHDSRGCGVLLALKSSLTTMHLPSPSDLEIVLAEIDPNLLVCLIYCPPNLTDQYNSSLLTYLNSLDGTKNIGDLRSTGTVVTGPANTGHVGTNYTLSPKRSYLNTETKYFCPVTCIIMPNKFILSADQFIAIACWDKKL